MPYNRPNEWLNGIQHLRNIQLIILWIHSIHFSTNSINLKFEFVRLHSIVNSAACVNVNVIYCHRTLTLTHHYTRKWAFRVMVMVRYVSAMYVYTVHVCMCVPIAKPSSFDTHNSCRFNIHSSIQNGDLCGAYILSCRVFILFLFFKFNTSKNVLKKIIKNSKLNNKHLQRDAQREDQTK